MGLTERILKKAMEGKGMQGMIDKAKKDMVVWEADKKREGKKEEQERIASKVRELYTGKWDTATIKKVLEIVEAMM